VSVIYNHRLVNSFKRVYNTVALSCFRHIDWKLNLSCQRNHKRMLVMASPKFVSDFQRGSVWIEGFKLQHLLKYAVFVSYVNFSSFGIVLYL